MATVHIIDGDKVLVVDDRVMAPCPCGHPLSECWGPDCGGPKRTIQWPTVKPIFAWYDIWVGAFWDAAKRRLYIFPVPMFGVVIQFEALLALAVDTSGVEKIDVSSCTNSSDAPAFGAAGDAQRKSEGGET